MAETRQQRLQREYQEEMARRKANPSSGGTNSQGIPKTGGSIPNQDLARQNVLDRAPKMLTARSLRENRPLYAGRRTSFQGQMLTDEQVKQVKPYRSAYDMKNYNFGRDGVGGTSVRKSKPTPRTGKVIFGDGDSRTLDRRPMKDMRDLPPPPPFGNDGSNGPPDPGDDLIPYTRGQEQGVRRRSLATEEARKRVEARQVPAFAGTNTDPQTGMIIPTYGQEHNALPEGYQGTMPEGQTQPNPQNVQIPTYGQEHNALPEGYRGQPPQGQPQYAENEFADLGRTPQMPQGTTGYSDNRPSPIEFRDNDPNIDPQIAMVGNERDLTREMGVQPTRLGTTGSEEIDPSSIQPFTVPMGADNVVVNTEGYSTQQEAYEATISGDNPPLETIEAGTSQPWDYDVQFNENGSFRMPTGDVATPGGTTTTDVVRSPIRKARELERIGTDLASKPAVQTAVSTMQNLANPQGVMDEFGREHIPPRIPPTEEEFFDDRESGGRTADQRRRDQLLDGAGGAMAVAGAGGADFDLEGWRQGGNDTKNSRRRGPRGGSSASNPKNTRNTRGTVPKNQAPGASKLGKGAKLWRAGKFGFKKVALPIVALAGAVRSISDNDDRQADQLQYIENLGGLAPNIRNSQEYPDPISGAISGAVNSFDVADIWDDGGGFFNDDAVDLGGITRRVGSVASNAFSSNPRHHLGFGGSPRATAFKEGIDNFVSQNLSSDASSTERKRLIARTEYRAAALQSKIQKVYNDYRNGTGDGDFDTNALSAEDKKLFKAMGGGEKQASLERSSSGSSGADRARDEQDAQIDAWEALSPQEKIDKQAQYEFDRQQPLDQGKPVSKDTGQFYRRVGEDGVVEFTTDGAEAFDGGYTPVDLPASAQPSKIAAQDGISSFPGNDFLKGINQDLKRRTRVASGQRRQAISNQRTIFDQAAQAVERMNIKGLTEGGRADMISEFAATLQQGRSAYDPKDLGTTKDLIAADRNEIYDEGNEIDSARNQAYNRRTGIDDAGRQQDQFLDRSNQNDGLVESILEGFAPNKFDDEGRELDQSGYRDGARNFIRSSGIRRYIDSHPNIDNQTKTRLVLDGAVGSQMVKWMREGGVKIDNKSLQMSKTGTTPLEQMISRIKENDPNIGVQLDGRDFYDMVTNPTNYFSWNGADSDKVVLRIGNKRVRLSELLNLGQGAAVGTAANELYQ
jgi:hypothetical protein